MPVLSSLSGGLLFPEMVCQMPSSRMTPLVIKDCVSTLGALLLEAEEVMASIVPTS